MPMPKEKSVTIQFEGWEVDIFVCESGNLGFTVYEPSPNAKNEDTRCRDIFVDAKTMEVKFV